MQTIEMYDLVSTAFEACPAFNPAFNAAFAAATDAAPVCGGCGWLESEHDQPGAEVHVLSRRAPARVTPKRLAS